MLGCRGGLVKGRRETQCGEAGFCSGLQGFADLFVGGFRCALGELTSHVRTGLEIVEYCVAGLEELAGNLHFARTAEYIQIVVKRTEFLFGPGATGDQSEWADTLAFHDPRVRAVGPARDCGIFQNLAAKVCQYGGKGLRFTLGCAIRTGAACGCTRLPSSLEGEPFVCCVCHPLSIAAAKLTPWVPWVGTSTMTDATPIVISLDGNIGAGKSTLLAALRAAMPDVEFVDEPVGEWMTLKNAEGKSLLELFYEDKRRWAYTFQNCAILTRLRAIKAAMVSTKKRVIVTERSVLTDRYVFAEMLRDSGDIDDLEWQLYLNWFDTFAAGLPLRGIIHLTTGVGTSAGRIVTRGRHGEEHIPLDYLSALDAQHHKWIANTPLPTLQLSTEATVPVAENIAAVRAFIERLVGTTAAPAPAPA